METPIPDGNESYALEFSEEHLQVLTVLASHLGYETPEQFVTSLLNHQATQEALIQKLSDEEIRSRLFASLAVECATAGIDPQELIADDPVTGPGFAPSLDSPFAIRFADALGFADAQTMLDAWHWSGEEDFFTWVNEYAQSMGIDVHAEVFGDSYDCGDAE